MDKVELEPIYKIEAPSRGVCISVYDAVLQIRQANTLTALRYSEIQEVSWHPRFKGEIYTAFWSAVFLIGLVGSLIFVVYRVFTGWNWDGVFIFGFVVFLLWNFATENRELDRIVVRIVTREGKKIDITFSPDDRAEATFGALIRHVEAAIGGVALVCSLSVAVKPAFPNYGHSGQVPTERRSLLCAILDSPNSGMVEAR